MAQSGYFTYTLSGSNATITGYTTTGTSNLTIPSTLDGYSVVAIGASAFSTKSLSGVLTIPSSVTSIGAYAFQYNGISNLTVPSSVTTLGNYAFRGNNLDVLTLSATITSSGTSPFDGTSIGNGLTISSNVTSIPNGMFATAGLTSLTIPSSVTSIGTYAFQYNGITYLEINHVMSLALKCFIGNSGIDVVLNANLSSTNLPFYDCSIGDGLTISSNVTSIPADMFNASGLTSVTIPSSVTSIGGSAFRNNYGLAIFRVYSDSISYGTSVLTTNMSSENKGTIYANDPSNTKTWWTNNYTGTYNFATLTSAPTVTTTSPVTLVTTSTAYVEGNVSSDGNATITERGFVYSTSENPTTADTKIAVSGTTGAMGVGLINLSEGTTYHVRAFASNSVGTSYGADVSFTTISPTKAYYDGTYPINPQWLPYGVTEMRLSWWSKLGQCKVKVKDHTNNNYFTLTDSEGNTGTEITFDSNANWTPRPHNVSFDVAEAGHTNCVDLRPEFYNLSTTQKLYINAPQLTWDRTKKWSQLYIPGKFCTATALGESIEDNENSVILSFSSPLAKTGNSVALGYDTNTLDVATNNLKVKDGVYSLSGHTHTNDHTHTNKSNIDTINQNMATTDDVTFDNVTGSIIQGTSAKFGNVAGGNYFEVEADGTYKLNGTATLFDDVLPSSVSVGVGVNAPAFTAYNGNLRAYEFVGSGATQKDIHMAFQFTHKYKEGTNGKPHLHLYVPNDATGGVIKVYCEWAWTNVDGVEGATSTYSGTLTIGANAGNLHKKLIIDSSVFTGTGKTISSILSCRFYRDPADEADTFASSVWLKSADVHVEMDTGGSRTETAK